MCQGTPAQQSGVLLQSTEPSSHERDALGELEEIVKQHGMPFAGAQVYMLPSYESGHLINITFQIPSQRSRYLCKVQEYWSQLLHHKGPGSLLSALKARRWATDIWGGESPLLCCFV
jgi:hypothetical protein